jgi:cytochrome c oxidase subunit IV
MSISTLLFVLALLVAIIDYFGDHSVLCWPSC